MSEALGSRAPRRFGKWLWRKAARDDLTDTIYRNYFVPIVDAVGQTAGRQIDALAGLGSALSELTGLPK